LIYPLIFLIGSLTSRGEKGLFLYGLIPFLIVIPGLILLVGYFKHSRGRLAEKYVPSLWMTTAIYNFLLLLPWLYGTSAALQKPNYYREDLAGVPVEFYYMFLLVSGYLAAVVSALKAYSFEKRRKYI
jgi:hypothetical protein